MRVLILGASGQLGTELAKTFADHHLLMPSHQELDLSQATARAAINQLTPDLVLLPAAFTNVDGCALDPARLFAKIRLAQNMLRWPAATAIFPWSMSAPTRYLVVAASKPIANTTSQRRSMPMGAPSGVASRQFCTMHPMFLSRGWLGCLVGSAILCARSPV